MYTQDDLNAINNIFNNPKAEVVFLLLVIWTFIWKGIALWRAAKNNQRHWFMILLIANTLGILEIIYLFYFVKPKNNQSDNKVS